MCHISSLFIFLDPQANSQISIATKLLLLKFHRSLISSLLSHNSLLQGKFLCIFINHVEVQAFHAQRTIWS
ncbi:unnamed protein product [Citrullus colocynthis]|uniref:Uncharacterized protein n=1 Tax=Citrullus colocynthis TaxID=252529 RepID=A0ABP0YPG6_9ROSI